MSDSTRRAAKAPSTGSGSGRRELLQTLPLPLAQLLRRALNGKSAAERHHGAFYLAEGTLKIASAARVGLWMDRALVPGGDLARKLEALVLPSLGHWCEMLRELTLALSKRPDVALLPPLCDAAALARKRPEWAHVAALCRRGVEVEIFGEEPAKQALRRGTLGFFDLVVAYRNVVIGHGAQRTSAFYEELARLLLDAVVEVLADPALLGGLELAQARLELDGETSHTTWYALTGLAGLPRDDDAGDAVPGHLYLIGPGARVPLHPLLVYRQEDELGREQVGFLNKAARKRPDREGVAGAVQRAEYLDYASGQTLDDVDARAALTALLARLEGRAVTPSDVDAKALATRAEAAAEPGDDAAPVGATIGDFELMGELGRGSMGVVYKARQRSLGRVVALKVLPPALAADRVAQKRFKNEMLALARCDHPNVVRILATGSDGDSDYYAMEYVDGSDLARAASLPVDRLAELFAGAADGLAHLHENGILHRDIKPGNLMVTADGRRVVIMDLGLAKLADASQALTSADVKILGTLRYMAPEQLQRRLVEVDARVDVYGLGAALYELATGRPIHDGETEVRLIQQVLNEEPMPPRRANPALRSDLAAVIQAATAKLPAQRYASAAAFAEDLRAVARDQPIRARPPGLARTAMRWAKRHRPLFLGLGAALLAIAAGGVALWDHQRLKAGYYAFYIDRRGAFEGVGEVPGPDGRSFTFKVIRRGGRMVTVECVNGRGAPHACGDFSSVEFHYADDGAISHRILRGPTGRFLAKYAYTYQGQKLQILRLDRHDLPLPELGDVAMYRFEVDAQGFRRKVTYFNDRGSPRQSFGAYGYDQTNDEFGEPTTLVFLDEAGAPLVRSDGVARATITWLGAGNEASRSFFGVDGKPVLNPGFAAEIRHRIDARGNQIERAFYGVDGKLALQADGIALWRARFDEHGCLVEKRFFGPDERLIVNKLGFASMASKCDENGREIERAHFGVAGERVVMREGFSMYRSRYDAQGNEVERSFFGADDRPLPNAGGAAVVRTTFDERGNVVEVASFGVDGRPVVVTAGRATIRYRHDDRDNEIERATFGVDGARVVPRDGCAIERAKFDERGKEIERACLGIDEKPRLTREGWAVVRSRVDERGKSIEKAYFGVNDAPALLRDGYAGLRIGYDDRGNENARTYLGSNGAPALNADGYAIWRGKSDERGRVIEETHFGPDGAPVLRARGYSMRTISYDAHGNVFERAHFDVGGRPVLRDDGYAIERSRYDARDNEIRREYLGVGGEPVLRKGGYAAFRASYDEVSRLVEKVYLDLAGNPVAAPPPDAPSP
ncbi:MAG: serine/threonine-protein kinase [Byssovorax sp.]